jgi:hypothetical protein
MPIVRKQNRGIKKLRKFSDEECRYLQKVPLEDIREKITLLDVWSVESFQGAFRS